MNGKILSDGFRNPRHAEALVAAIHEEADSGRHYRIMEFCGGHTHAIARNGLADLLPDPVKLVHGPGCPVCVLPVGRLIMAMELAQREEVILTSYGDMLRVPAGPGRSLTRARAEGADVRMVYSPLDALEMARANPHRQVVFLAIGFETTAPATAAVVKRARAEGIDNFSVLCNHVVTVTAMTAVLDGEDGRRIDGLIGPGHVSCVIGADAFAGVARHYQRPIVISGFEPLDMLDTVLRAVRRLNAGEAGVENAYGRALDGAGNKQAQALMAEVFALRESFEWRGLGTVAASGYRLADDFAAFDAESRFELQYRVVPEPKSCECPSVLRGAKEPEDCVLFGKACTPEQPVGACMVSSEGACAAAYLFRRDARRLSA